MSHVDIQEILANDQPLVFAADQTPFSVATSGITNHFCVLVPLMTRDGRRVEPLERNFPDRGRVWWMLRPDIRIDDVQPGTLWTGRIENAVKRDKDAFQVVRPSITAGAKDWVEVVDLDEADPGIARLCSNRGIPFGRRPLQRVIVRGTRFAYGPFITNYDERTGALLLRARNAGDPTARRIPTSELDKGVPIERFAFQSSLFDPNAHARQITIGLLHDRHLAKVEEMGQLVDAQSEDQLVKWALGLADYTNRQRSEFRAALDALPSEAGGDARHAERLERFRGLCTSSERIADLGVEIARVVAGSGPLRELVDRHAEEIGRARIQEEIDKAREHIERQTEQAQRDRLRAEQELRGLEESIGARRAEQEARLRAENQAWLDGLKQRESDLDAREAALGLQQQELENRLQGVIHQYAEHADAIVNQVLTYAPLLRGLYAPAIGGTAARGERPEREEPSRGLPTPSWAAHRIEPSKLDQAGFLDQFRRVVERRGFVFHDDDLLNFHVSALSGSWTVIAGPTGLGKSSLPRLYAEALGMRERYLKVPVQPDWLDDRDVLGAYNSLSKRFEPAPTGLVETLVHAARDLQSDGGGVFLICLDEMNLSRVEHYFARFLSILEDPIDQRRLRLLPAGVGTDSDPFTAHRELPIGPNVRLVGTVNVDETTHFFSPKVLDRATLMLLEDPDLGRTPQPSTRTAELLVQPIPFAEWSGWAANPADADDAHRRLVLDLDGELRRIQSGLGYRLRDRILTYLATAKPLLSPDRALDLAVSQTVLPRLRTHHPNFPAVVTRLLERLPADRFARTGRILEALRDSEGSHDFFQLL